MPHADLSDLTIAHGIIRYRLDDHIDGPIEVDLRTCRAPFECIGGHLADERCQTLMELVVQSQEDVVFRREVEIDSPSSNACGSRYLADRRFRVTLVLEQGSCRLEYLPAALAGGFRSLALHGLHAPILLDMNEIHSYISNLMNPIQSSFASPRRFGVPKSLRSWLGIALVVILVAQGAALYERLTSTEAVDRADVLAEYRARQNKVDPSATTGVPSGESQPQTTASQLPASSAGGAPQRPAGQAPSAAADCDWVCPTALQAPEAGVYSYFQCSRTAGQCTGSNEPEGWEEISGVRRSFKREGSRYVTVSSKTQWNNVHFYADEHKEEFDLSIDETGVYVSRYKVDITFGPVPGGIDIRQEPPFRITAFPLAVGQKWNGSWKDANGEADADYTSEVVGKEEITVAGKTYRTWVLQHHLTFKGPKNFGTADLRFWLSPELRQPVQEFYDQKLDTPQGPYRGYWMVTLANPKPTR